MITSPVPEKLGVFFRCWKLRFQLCTHKIDDFCGLGWNGEDLNLRAFNSKAEFAKWYCHHPPTPEKYRDWGFYPRELTALSWFIEPEVIVELGTNLGIGAYLLSILNPTARALYTVDNADGCDNDGHRLEIGHISKINRRDVTYIKGISWQTIIPDRFNLCFIDADHSYEGVMQDSQWAWANRNPERWAIIWHDCQLDSVQAAVSKFAADTHITIYKQPDSNVAWAFEENNGQQ